jgi:hypothetical protein
LFCPTDKQKSLKKRGSYKVWCVDVAVYYRIISIAKVFLPKTLQDSSYYLDNREKFENYRFKMHKLRVNFNSKNLT